MSNQQLAVVEAEYAESEEYVPCSGCEYCTAASAFVIPDGSYWLGEKAARLFSIKSGFYTYLGEPVSVDVLIGNLGGGDMDDRY